MSGERLLVSPRRLPNFWPGSRGCELAVDGDSGSDGLFSFFATFAASEDRRSLGGKGAGGLGRPLRGGKGRGLISGAAGGVLGAAALGVGVIAAGLSGSDGAGTAD